MAITYLSGATASDSGSFSVTANAGSNRIMVVATVERVADSVTAVSWNGNSLTQLLDTSYDNTQTRVWYRAIGTSVSNEAATMTVTSTNASNLLVVVAVYDNVSQSSPIQNSAIANSAGSSVGTHSTGNITYTGSTALVVAGRYGEQGGGVSNAGYTNRQSAGNLRIGEYTDSDGSPTVATTTSSPDSTGLTVFGMTLALQEDVTVSPSVITGALSIIAPSVTGGATVSPAVISLAAGIQAPIVTIETSDWTNPDKSTTTGWVTPDKS